MLTSAANDLITRSDAGTPLGEFFRRFWVPCLLSAEVEEPDCPPVRVKVLGEELVAFRDTDGRVGLIDAYCAHRGAELFFGRNEECGLRCVYHGWKYDVNGRCVDMPNEPAESRFKEHIRLKAYPTTEAGGIVWAYMGPPDKVPQMPDLEWLRLDESQWMMEKFFVDSNYLQALEGDHDSSHASILHSNLTDQLADSALIQSRQQFTDLWMRDKAPRLHVLETDYGILTGASRTGSSSNSLLWRISAWLVPWFSMIAAEPGTPIMMNVLVPRDDETSWLYKVVYSPDRPFSWDERERLAHHSFPRRSEQTFRLDENYENSYKIDRYRQRYETFSGIESVAAQDRAVTERMRPAPGGSVRIVDRSQEHLGSADAAIIILRKKLARYVEELQQGTEPLAAHKPEIYHIRTPSLELPQGVAFDIGAADYINCTTWQPVHKIAASEGAEGTAGNN